MLSEIIFVRIKFVVPFKIPFTERISFAARQTVRGRIIGIPPPTLASNMKFTFFSFAISRSSRPFSATSSLFEVTTCFPAERHFETKSNAGVVPPMVSTTISVASSFSMSLKSFVNLLSFSSPGKSRRSRI